MLEAIYPDLKSQSLRFYGLYLCNDVVSCKNKVLDCRSFSICIPDSLTDESMSTETALA